MDPRNAKYGASRARRRVAAAVAAAIGCGSMAASVAATPAVEGDGLEEVQITGSRIVRRDLEAPTPVVTVERETFTNSAFTSVEQVLLELPQFVAGGISGGNAGLAGEFLNNDVQPTATNTPGSATVNLRGLGANRSLTLIDGRRGQPSNASLTIDLNTIPSSAIASVEVITGGASSVYGADALAGVTNFKLRDTYKGVELTARGGINEEGWDGKDWQLSALMGTSLGGEGSAMVAMEWYKRQNALRANRDWFSDAYTDSTVGANLLRLNFPSIEFPNSATAGPAIGTSGIYTGNSPSQAALNAAFPGRPAGSNIPLNSNVFINRDNSLFLSGSQNQTTPTNFSYGGLGFNSAPVGEGEFKLVNTYNSTGQVTGQTLGQNDLDTWLTSPLERFSIFGRAKYNLGDHLRAYVQTNFVSTTVLSRLQVTGATGNFTVAVPHGTEVYLPSVVGAGQGTATAPVGSTRPEYRQGGTLGLNCPATGGCTLSQAFPTPAALSALLDSRAGGTGTTCTVAVGASRLQNPLTGTDIKTCGPNAAWRLSQTLSFLPTRGTENEQRLFQIIGGLEGDLGLGDWTWEAYFSHGNTLLEASYIGYPSTFQYRAIASAPNYGRNYQSPLVLSSKSATCATGLPIFQQFPISKDCVDAILTDSSDRSQLEQTIYEANLQGGVFELPAGQLRAAAGASYRTNSYIFRPDPIRATNYFQDVGVGQFGAVTSGGETRVREVYGELLVPVLKDLPGAQKLDLELGFRQSMYDTGAGDVSTYKILGVWSPLQWINIRGGYQKANRAPNIAELFLGETTIVTFNGVDPCRSGVNTTNNWYNNATNPNRAQTQALCSAQIGNPGSDFNADPNSFNSGGGGLGIQLGNPALKSESGETWTLGTVFRSPFESALARGMSLSVDYFKAEISDNIGIPDAQSILDACFNRQGENPTYSLDDAGGNCRRINRDQFTGGLSRVLTPYQNLGGLKTSGIDVGFSWRASLADLGTNLPGNTSFSAQATHVIEYLSQTTATSAPLDNVGYSNLPKWRLNTRVGYSLREFSAGLTWRFQTSVDSAALQTNPAAPNLGGPAYSRFDGNAGYGFGPLDVRLSISNLLNKAPPTYGNNPWSTGAGTFLPGADLVGRRYTVTATMRL